MNPGTFTAKPRAVVGRSGSAEVKPVVSLVDTAQHPDLTQAVHHALALINFDFSKRMKKVAIKPNLCYYWKPTSGETTDPKLVEGVIDVLRSHHVADEICLVESDATAMRMKHAVRMLGYEDLARRAHVQLINLAEDVQLPVDSEDPVLGRLRIPKTLTEVDFFISMPKLKIHTLTGLTCALKNQFGCIPLQRKIVFHKDIDRVIAFMNSLVPPDLIMVDGIVSLGRTPRRLNLIVAGYDPVAVDSTAARIAGLNPRRIGHVARSESLGLGRVDPRLVGEELSQYARIFPRRGLIYNTSRKALADLYGLYLSLFTSDGRLFKSRPTWVPEY